MKKILISLAALFALGINGLQAQDDNVIADPNAKLRTLNAPFTGISVTSGIELVITQGNTESIAVSASDEQYYERFKSEVVDGVLKLYFDFKDWKWKKDRKWKLKAYVSYKTLNKLYGSAGASVKAATTINAGDLDMRFTSGSTFKGAINAREVSMDQNSGADVKLSGKADKLTIDISSGAMFDAYDLFVDYCDAKASSGASVHIGVNKEISGKASSGASVRFKGEGNKTDTHTNSGGEIKKA